MAIGEDLHYFSSRKDATLINGHLLSPIPHQDSVPINGHLSSPGPYQDITVIGGSLP